MKHNWQEFIDPENPHRAISGPQRCCKHCVAIQIKETQYLWGRVVGYRWLPLVGRCVTQKS